MQPIKIYKSTSKDRRVILPFQYYTECDESLFCLVYSSHEGNARVYMHYDEKMRFIAKSVLSDFYINTENINPFKEMEKGIPIKEISFKSLLFDMHLAASPRNNNWYDKKILNNIKKRYSKPPIIIGGCGRSGTTLLLSVLSAHSSIQAINDEIYAFYPRPYRLHRLEMVLAKEKKEHKHRWCEKTPKNIHAIPDVLELFGNETKFIHIVRDPRDVITSVHPNHPDQFWVPSERWLEDVKEGLIHQEHTLIVRYEDLVVNMKDTVHKICDYIGESFEKQMLDIEKNATVRKNIAWGSEHIKPMHTSSVKRWKEEKFQDRISKLMGNEQITSLMTKLGYL